MALTIRQISDEQKEIAKELTGKGAASAAVVACVDLAAQQARRIEIQNQELAKARDRIRQLEGVQDRLAQAADEALCIIRQRELLT